MLYRDGYSCLDSRANTGFGIFLGYLLWIGILVGGFGTQVGNRAILYLILGIITLAVKTVSVMRSGETTLAQEIAFGFKNGEIFTELLLWPVIALLFIFRDPYQNSFKFQYHNSYWQEIMSGCHGIHVKTVNEWTDTRIAGISNRADEQAERMAETVKPVARVAVAGATAIVITTSSAHPQEATKPESPTVQAKIFADRAGDRQTSFTASQKNFVFLEQNRVSADGNSNTSLLGFGIKLPPIKGINTTLIGGPQFSWKNNGKYPLIKGIFISSWKRNRFSVFFKSWFGYGMKERKITASRHIQTFGIPVFPSWLSLNFEEFHSAKSGFGEVYTGLTIKFGQWFRKDNFFHGAWLTPYYNWAKGKERFDVRIGLSF